MATPTLPPELTRILLGQEQLQGRIRELGNQISRDYQGEELLLICVLKGSILFTADLMRTINTKVRVDFISISSYGDSTKSSGVVRLVKDVDSDISGQHVLIVEDIVDTGLTLNYLRESLEVRNPASLKICSLLSKPSRRKVEVAVDYLGFEIEDHFVVGYGLDYRGLYRNLPYIGELRVQKS